MTLLKKSLSLLLALIVVFSSVNVMAFAADWWEENNELQFEIKFFRQKDGEWIETTKAKPGEDVRARLYVSTEYPTGSVNLSFAYNSKFFSVDYLEDEVFDVPGNDSFPYSQGTIKTVGSDAMLSTDLTPSKFPINKNNALVTNGYISEQFVNNFDVINLKMAFDSANPNSSKAWKLDYKDADDHVLEFELKVNNDDYVKTPGRVGEGLVPASTRIESQTPATVTELKIKEGGTLKGGLVLTKESYEKIGQSLPINMRKNQAEGQNSYLGKTMQQWMPVITSSTIGEISVFSNVVLNRNGGFFFDANGNRNYEDKFIPGIIGENYNPSDDDAYVPNKDGKKHIGWHTDANATVPMTDAELSQLVYDYEDITLYAIYGEPDSYYCYTQVYLMDENGNYNNPPIEGKLYGQKDETAKMPTETQDKTMYEFDETQVNILEGKFDNASVLKAYYKRVKYDVIYNVDANTKWSPDDKVFHGADVPDYGGDEFDAPEGKRFVGWSVNENDTTVNVPEEMPAKTLNLYPVYADNDTVTYLFDANQGVFTSDNTTLKSHAFEIGANPKDTVDNFEKPSRDGYAFDGWDPEAPDEATKDLVFKAKWKEKEYTITFVVNEGGKFQDGTTADKEVTFKYGEEVKGSAKVPGDPEREDGWNFLMWNPTLPEKMPSQNLVVTSMWTKQPVYTVKFADSLNASVVYGETKGVEGTDVDVPDVSDKNPGYKFAGWVLDGATEPADPDAKIGKEDKTYYAKWEEDSFAITFNTNGGTPSTIPQISADYKDDISDKLPEDPTMKGHDFTGWVDSNKNVYPTKNDLPKTMPVGGLKLTANWKPKSYPAVFITNANNGDKVGGGDVEGKFATTATTEYTDYAEYNKPVEFPEVPSAVGYTFSHWETVDGKQYKDNGSLIMSDKTVVLYAQYNYNETGTSYYDIEINTENLDGTYTTRKLENQSIETGKSIIVSTTGSSTAYLTLDYSGLLTADEKKSQEPDPDNANNNLEITSASETEENVLVVYFKRKTVKATFDPNGGQFADANESGIVQGKYGSTLTAPELKDREGYEGYTWEPSVPNTLEEDGVTYEANWTKKKANAIFYINGVLYKTIPYEFGDTIADPGYTPEPGKTFSGWTPAVPNTMGEENMVFNATVTDKEYKVTYEVSAPADFADKAPTDSKTYKYNDEAKVLAAPEVKGYEFKGWYLDNDKSTTYSADAKITITDSVKLYGEYVKKNYDVQFDLDGGKYDGSSLIPAQNYDYNEKLADIPVEKEKFVKDRYEFIGWADKDGNVYTPESTMPDGDIVLIAQWKEVIVPHDVTYSYSIDVPGAPTLPTATQALKDTVIDLPDAPVVGDELGDYKFVGWTVNGESKTGSFVMPNEKAEVVGVWVKKDAKEFTVTVNATDGKFTNGTEDPSDDTKTKVYKFFEGQPIAGIEIPVLDKYEHAGWDPELPTVMPGENIEADAKWKQIKFTLTADANGGSFKNGEKTKEYIFEVGETVNGIEQPTNAEMVFDGWDTELPFVMPENDVKISAQWKEPEPAEFKVIVDANGGKFEDGTTTKEYTFKVGETVTGIEQPTNGEMIFDGWDTELPFAMPENDVKISAQWKEPEPAEFKIIVDANGGKFEDGTTTKEYTFKVGEIITGIEQPTNGEMIFDGWDPTLPSVMPENDVKISAQWREPEPDEFKIIVDANGGKFEDGTTTKEYTFKVGETVTGIEQPTNGEMIFDGWDPTLPSVMPENDVKISAQWKEPAPEEYTIKIDPNGGTFPDGTTDPYEEKVVEGDEITNLPGNPTKQNHEFKGWLNSETGEIVDKLPEKMPSDNVTFIAQWEEIGKNKVTYYLVEGGAVYAEDAYYEGETIVLPEAPVVEGFDFGGWVTDIAEGTKLPEKMGAEDIVAYAILTPRVHSVTYYLNAEKTEVYKEYDEVMFGSEVPVPADPISSDPTLIFAGWEPAPVSVMPDSDLEYVATWAKKPVAGEQYVAKFTVDGKTHALFVLEEGETIPKVSEPTKFGFVFKGWEPTVPEIMPGKDVEFVAQWEVDDTFVYIVIGGTVVSGVVIGSIIGSTNAAIITGAAIIGGILVIWGASELVKNTYTVTYMVDGEVYKTYKVLAGTKIPVPADPAKDGATFKGWNPEVPEKMPAEDLVFEATWSSDTNVEIPDTGSVAGAAAFAVIAAAGAGAYLFARKKKEEEN